MLWSIKKLLGGHELYRYLWVGLFCSSLLGCSAAGFPEGKEQGRPTLGQRQFMTASDGTELAVYQWQPSGQVRGNILLLHGFNEYSGAFDQVAQQFTRQGLRVRAYDQRGFGRSPHRGLWSNAELMARDAREMTALIRKAEPKLPLTLVGMSMGGAVALLAASEKTAADAVVLVAPAVWVSEMQPFYQRWALDIAKTLTPAWSPTGEDLKIRPSDNVALLREIWASPWMIRKSRMDAVAGLVDLMDKGYAAADSMQLPVLLLYGDKDELVPEEPINKLWEKLPRKGNTRQIRYPQGWHMLMRDLQGKRVIADIVDWLPKQ